METAEAMVREGDSRPGGLRSLSGSHSQQERLGTSHCPICRRAEGGPGAGGGPLVLCPPLACSLPRRRPAPVGVSELGALVGHPAGARDLVSERLPRRCS